MKNNKMKQAGSMKTGLKIGAVLILSLAFIFSGSTIVADTDNNTIHTTIIKSTTTSYNQFFFKDMLSNIISSSTYTSPLFGKQNYMTKNLTVWGINHDDETQNVFIYLKQVSGDGVTFGPVRAPASGERYQQYLPDAVIMGAAYDITVFWYEEDVGFLNNSSSFTAGNQDPVIRVDIDYHIPAGLADRFIKGYYSIGGERYYYPNRVSPNEMNLINESGMNWASGLIGSECIWANGNCTFYNQVVSDYMNFFSNVKHGAIQLVLQDLIIYNLSDQLGYSVEIGLDNTAYLYDPVNPDAGVSGIWKSAVDATISNLHSSWGQEPGFNGYYAIGCYSMHNSENHNGLLYICQKIHEIDPTHKIYIESGINSQNARVFTERLKDTGIDNIVWLFTITSDGDYLFFNNIRGNGDWSNVPWLIEAVDNHPEVPRYNYTAYSGVEFQYAAQYLMWATQGNSEFFKDSDFEFCTAIQTCWREGYRHYDALLNRWVTKDFRWPTYTEMQLQGYLPLLFGVDGILGWKFDTYGRDTSPMDPPSYDERWTQGVLSFESAPRHKLLAENGRFPPEGTLTPYGAAGGYYPYDAVRDLFRNLSIIGPIIRNLKMEKTFSTANPANFPKAAGWYFAPNPNINPIPGCYITQLSGDYIEGATYTGSPPGLDYFMLVNRVCNNPDATPANPQTVTFNIQKKPNTRYFIYDVVTGDSIYKGTTDANGFLNGITISLGPGEGRLLLLSSVQNTECAKCGDANSDESVDISDAVFLIQYIFGGGPAPGPCCTPNGQGDANGDGEVDISDAVYLISYIFGGGPAPHCP